MNILKKKINIYEALLSLFVMYITISSVFSPLRVIVPNNIVLIILFSMLWILVTLIKTPRFYINFSLHQFSTLFLVAYTFIFSYITNNQTIGNRYAAISPLFFLIIVYKYHKKYFGLNNVKYIIKTTLFFVFLTVLRTIFALLRDPQVSRSLKTFGDYSYRIYLSGVGGYELIYFLVLLVPIFLLVLFKTSKNKKRVIFYFILILLTIVLSNFFTAIIITIVSFILYVLFDKISNSYSAALLLPFSIIIILLSEIIIVRLIRFAMSLVSHGKTYERLLTILNTVLFNTEINLYGSRTDLIQLSLETFRAYTWIGLTGAVDINSSIFDAYIGQHSHLLDTFALFGLFIGILQIYVLIYPYAVRIKYNTNKTYLITMMFAIIAILVFNIATPSLGVAYSFTGLYMFDWFKDNDTITLTERNQYD